MKRQEEESLKKQEEMGRQHLTEMRDCYETMERDRSDCEKWRKKYELLEVKSKKQIEYYRTEMHKLSRELETENRSLLANGGGGGKAQKMQMEKMDERNAKLQDELGQERDLIKKIENQMGSLKREIKGLKHSEN